MNLHRLFVVIISPLFVLFPDRLAAEEDVTALVSRGRSEYLAGDAAAAERTFNEVNALEQHNATSEYFLKRIEQERERTRVRMLAEVDQAWQRPETPIVLMEDGTTAAEASPLWRKLHDI